MHLSTKTRGLAALLSASTTARTLTGVIKPVLDGPAQPQLVPYHASIEQYGKAKCSGALIWHNYVLTAAGCVAGGQPDEFVVRLGASNAQQGGQVVALADILIHPLFVGDEGYYDLAILTLAQDVPFGEDVNQVLLPSRRAPNPSEGTPCTASGYDPLSENLETRNVSITNGADCAAFYEGIGRPIANTTLCVSGSSPLASAAQQGGCHPLNVGAPLVDATTGLLIGLGSSRYDCEVLPAPDVYTNIPWVHSWITIVTGL